MAAASARITISAIDKTSKGFRSVGSGLKSLTSSIFSMKTALVGVAGIAGFGYLVKSSLNSADALAKTASKIGTTTEALSKLRYAASITGVEANTLDMAMQRFTRRTAEAAAGTGEAKAAIAELGLNAKKLQQLPLDEQMQALSAAFSNVENDSDKLRLAFKLFDSEGAALVNTLALGEKGMEELFGRAEALGLVMSGSAAAGAERANDALSDLFSIVKGLKDQFSAALAPAIELVTEKITDFLIETKEADGGIKKFAENLAKTFLESAMSVVRAMGSILAAVDNTVNFLVEKVNGVRLTILEDELEYAQRNAELFASAYKTILGGGSLSVKDTIKLKLKGVEDDLASLDEAWSDSVSAAAIAKMAIFDIGQQGEGLNLSAMLNVPEAISNIEELKAAIGTIPETVTSGNQTIQGSNNYTQQLQKEGAVDLAKFNAMNGAEQTKNVLTNMGKELSATKGQSKKLFAIQKAASIGKAIMSTYEGATKAMAAYPPPINFAMAAAVVAGGLAQVSSIRSQSFDGGGFTGHGSRSGGVDGKGGFNAILHPNETVIDHTKGGGLRRSGGGQAVIINQTINVSTGVVQTVRAEVANLLPQIADAAKGAVADARQRGGSYSQAIIGA